MAEAQTVLTLDQCLAIAREHNLSLRAAENDVESSKLSREELLTTKLPETHLEGSAIYAPSSGHFGYDPIISNSGQLSAQIVAKQSVYDGGVRNLRIDEAAVDIGLRNKELRQTERDLVYSVKQAYIETLRSKDEIQLQQESARQLAEYLERVKQLSGAGSASYTDILKTQVQLADAKISLEESEQAYANAKYSLAELLGTSIDTTFTVAGTLSDLSSTSADSTLLESDDSLQTLDLSIAAMTIQRNALEVDLTRHELSPLVSIVGDAGLLTSRDNLRLPYDQRAGLVGYSVGLLIEFPFFNWGATDLRVQQKERAVSDLQFQYELLRRSYSSESKKLRSRLGTLRKRLAELRENQKMAEENFLMTKSKYLSGGALSLEVLSAQQLLTDSKISELETLAEIGIVAARMEQLYAE